MSLIIPEYQWVHNDGPAFGGPGVSPRWTSSSKDVVATAYAASSRVWFTVSHGILNEIYYPTIDRPQIRDMELLFTDGESFFHEEKRDFEANFEYIDPDALAVRITSQQHDKGYTIHKRIISDPHHSIVLVHVRLEGPEELLAKLKTFALLSPHVDGGGSGNNGRAVCVAGKKILLAWKDNTSVAFGVDCGFTRTSCGFVGSSDGWQDLDENFKMDWQFDQAINGNIAIMGEIDTSSKREFTLAISFGDGHHAALSGLMQSLADPFDGHLTRFINQWHRSHQPSALAAASCDKGRLLRISQQMILTHEDKTFSGAFIASASIPWGQAKGDEDLGGYHLVWTRDMTQSATALLACDRVDTARRALVYLACSQKPDGGFSQNFWVNGTPYWGGTQLDETAFPIMLAWRLWKLDGLGAFNVFTFATQAAGYLVRQAPITQQERWEENAGYSPSTLAAVIGGLICAAEIARHYKEPVIATFIEEYADWIESHLEEWMVTDEGILHPDVKRHYMRIRPPQCGEPYATDLCAQNKIRVANRAPGEPYEFEARAVIDHGFLELVRYGIRRPDDPLIVDSLKVVDHVLKRDTPNGPAWRRYNHDGYGEAKDGSPFIHYGQGRCWPLLGGERAHYEFAAGRDVKPFIRSYESFASSGGMMPEQIWDEPTSPKSYLEFGKPAGSAMPLVWAHAEYIKLLRSVTDGRVFDMLAAVEDRYKNKRGRKDIEIFKLRRHVTSMDAGKTLRMISAKPFRLTWTNDDWATVKELEATHVGAAGYFADMPTTKKQKGPISFTLFWPDENRWEGQNFNVSVTPGPGK